VVTLNNLGKINTKMYSPQLYGKNIIISNSGQSMDVEIFVPLVVYTMIPIDYDKEIIKSQMVTIRTYIIYKMGENNTINAEDLSLPYTTYSELEKSWGKKYEKNYNYTMKLLTETNCEIMYYDNEVICPYYHELSAGVTNSGEYPYLKSIDVGIDKEADDFLNITYLTFEEMKENLGDNISDDVNLKDIFDAIKVNYEENGQYVQSVEIGNNSISAEEFARNFNLPSTAFNIEKITDEKKSNGTFSDEEVSMGIKITSKGKGDGLGMSINGAINMAKEGKKYNEILLYFFSNIEIR
jgi:stage II sporulation protein D